MCPMTMLGVVASTNQLFAEKDHLAHHAEARQRRVAWFANVRVQAAKLGYIRSVADIAKPAEVCGNRPRSRCQGGTALIAGDYGNVWILERLMLRPDRPHTGTQRWTGIRR